MHYCIKMLYFCKSPRRSRRGLRLATVNNTARERRQGWIAALRRGKSDIRSVFARRPPILFPFFHTKCLRGDVKKSFSGEGRCHITERLLDFLRKSQCWTEILIPSHDKMAAVDSFDTKKFFFLFQIVCGGGGAAQSRPAWKHRRRWPPGALRPRRRCGVKALCVCITVSAIQICYDVLYVLYIIPITLNVYI